jgi:hypothetical protein
VQNLRLAVGTLQPMHAQEWRALAIG